MIPKVIPKQIPKLISIFLKIVFFVVRLSGRHGPSAGDRLTTFVPTGPTFYGTFTNTTVDFIGLPVYMQILHVCTLLHSAERLQNIPVARLHDHVPLQCCFNYRLGYQAPKHRLHLWDRNLLAEDT